jgi:hypothetical protein
MTPYQTTAEVAQDEIFLFRGTHTHTHTHTLMILMASLLLTSSPSARLWRWEYGDICSMELLRTRSHDIDREGSLCSLWDEEEVCVTSSEGISPSKYRLSFYTRFVFHSIFIMLLSFSLLSRCCSPVTHRKKCMLCIRLCRVAKGNSYMCASLSLSPAQWIEKNSRVSNQQKRRKNNTKWREI